MTKKHWIYIKRGLSEDAKHRAAMGECIWLYMHIIDRADWETGIAFDWKDKEEAVGMSMPVDTLRRQRQKLQELDYIRTEQKQHSQNIFIMEWKNPRSYDSETRNPRDEGSHEQPPLENEGLNQGSNQGSNQGLNQGQAQVKTPTYSSKSKSSSLSEEPPPTPTNSISPLIKAEQILCNAANLPALPHDFRERLETVLQLVDTYGEEKTATALKDARSEWIKNKRKDNSRNYSVLNPTWIDWAIAHLAGETPWKNNGKATSLLEKALADLQGANYG